LRDNPQADTIRRFRFSLKCWNILIEPAITDYGNGLVSHGSENLFQRIMQIKPVLHLFGHEHSANGLMKENGIIFSNSSLLDDKYEIKFPPRLIKI